MSDFEIATLRAEIARLNKLITVLIEQNDALKHEIAVANSTNGNPDVGIANANITNGNPEIGGAHAKVTNGNPEHALAFTKVTNGNPESAIALANITKGNPDVGGAFAKITNGNTEHSIAVAKVTNGNTNVLGPLPATLSMDMFNITRLRAVLKKEGFNKVRHKAVANASKLLLLFYNKQRGDYNELRKLTGLSNFGLAKYIRSLKKRGLIQRDGWQKFKLTASALNLIQQAGCTA